MDVNKVARLLVIFLPSLTINSLIASSVLASNPPVTCTNNLQDYQPEEPSELTRVIKLDKFGFSITMPANYRAMLKNDGTIEIIDNGTYRLAYCVNKGKNPVGTGRGYDALVVSKSNEYLYSNVLDRVPEKENIFMVAQTFEGDFGNKYRILLRIKTPKGIINLENWRDGIIEGEESAIKEIEYLKELSNNIEIHNDSAAFPQSKRALYKSR